MYATTTIPNFYLVATNIIDNPGGLPNEQAQIGLSEGLYASLGPDTFPDGYYDSFGTELLTFMSATIGTANIFTISEEGWLRDTSSTVYRADVEDGFKLGALYWDYDATVEESVGTFDSPICTANICGPYPILSCDNNYDPEFRKTEFALCRTSNDPEGTNGYLFMAQDYTLAGVNCTGVTLMMVDAST
jgi:hypothetical protein